jgi:hypothetical protein
MVRYPGSEDKARQVNNYVIPSHLMMLPDVQFNCPVLDSFPKQVDGYVTMVTTLVILMLMF